MFRLRSVVLVLSLVLTSTLFVLGSDSKFSELIRRIHEETNSATVLFISANEDFLTQFMRNHSNIPVAVFTTFFDGGDYKCPFYSNVILAAQNSSDKLKGVQQIVEKLWVRNFVVIYSSSFQKLQQSFSYFTKMKFTRLFGIADNKKYAYLPYADIKIQELAENSPLPHAMKNLNGLEVRTIIENHIPRIFHYKDVQGKYQIGGRMAHIFIHFLKAHNATLKEIYLNNLTKTSNMVEIQKHIKSNLSDISMNNYIFGQKAQGIAISYPVEVKKVHVMVPINGFVNPYHYVLRPFSPVTWICIGLTLAYITLMDFLKERLLGLHGSIWHCFTRALLPMLNFSPPTPSTQGYRFHAQVYLLSFILFNLFTIYFTSYLTVYIKIKQYDTIKDVIDSDLMILIADVITPGKYSLTFFTDFRDKLITIDPIILITERNSMRNTSFAYLIASDSFEFFIGIRKFSSKPLFQITRDYIKETFLVYLLEEHSPLEGILNDFIIYIQQTGLVQKWTLDSLKQGLQTGLYIDKDRSLSDQDLRAPLTLHTLEFAWNCLKIGFILATVVFLIERYNNGFKWVLTYVKNKFR